MNDVDRSPIVSAHQTATMYEPQGCQVGVEIRAQIYPKSSPSSSVFFAFAADTSSTNDQWRHTPVKQIKLIHKKATVDRKLRSAVRNAR